MKEIPIFLALGVLLLGCTTTEPQGTITYGEPEYTEPEVPEEEVPVPEEPSAQEQLNDSLPEPTEPTPELHISFTELETGGETTEKEYSGVEVDGYSILLEDVAPSGTEYCALIKIAEVDGTQMRVLDRAQICPGESYYWISPEMHKYRIKVLEVASGYADQTAWADIVVYT